MTVCDDDKHTLTELVVMDLEQEVVAVRGWNLAVTRENEYFLTSPSRGYALWPKRRAFTGVCIPVHGRNSPLVSGVTEQNSAHTAPDITCNCGVYGLKAGVPGAAGCIVGEVYLFGNYLEHNRGFRAQHGYPRSLNRFRCAGCKKSYNMNDIWIARVPPPPLDRQVVYPPAQLCFRCRANIGFIGNNGVWITLAHVIEELEYEYDLEVD